MVLDGFDSVQPLDASRANVAQDHHSEREAVDCRQGLAVHLPTQQNLVRFDLRPGNTDDVVHRCMGLEVSVGAVELEMLCAADQPTASFDDFFEADSDIFGRTDGSFGPWSLGYGVTLAGICVDLLDSARARALHRCQFGDSGKSRFILKVVQSEFLRVGDESVEIEVVLLLVNDRDTSVIPNEMEIVGW